MRYLMDDMDGMDKMDKAVHEPPLQIKLLNFCQKISHCPKAHLLATSN